MQAAGAHAALGKVAVPIQPSHSIRARFDHFVAAPIPLGEGAAGSRGPSAGGTMTVNKLRIWDRLVEILGPAAVPTGDTRTVAADRVDAAIETVRARLDRRGLLPEGGTFVNLFA